MQDKGNHNEFLKLQIYNNLMGLSKSFLCILQQLKEQNQISESDFAIYRSKILGKSNDDIRFLNQIIDSLNIELKRT